MAPVRSHRSPAPFPYPHTKCVCVGILGAPLALHHLQPVKPSQIPQLARGRRFPVLPAWGMGRERAVLTPVRKGPYPRGSGGWRVRTRRDGSRREPAGVEGAKVKVPGRTGD